MARHFLPADAVDRHELSQACPCLPLVWRDDDGYPLGVYHITEPQDPDGDDAGARRPRIRQGGTLSK